MKKNFLLSIYMLAFVSFSLAQSNIEVTIKNIKGSKGSMRVGLFNDAEKFLKTPVKGQIIKVSGETMKVVFENVPDGKYAASVIHDENENGELDSNFIGIPKEGFGFSNNVMGNFGPPDFEKASFNVTNMSKALAIDLKYY